MRYFFSLMILLIFSGAVRAQTEEVPSVWTSTYSLKQALLKRLRRVSIALAGAHDTFYTVRNGINFVSFRYKKVVEIEKYLLHVQATPAWNPDAKHAYMEVALMFF